MINKKYTTKNCGELVVLRKSSKYNYFECKFLTTGSIKTLRKDAIVSGEVQDNFAKTVMGVGCIGNVSTKRENARAYSVWNNMINRCYNPNNSRYSAYGGNGVTVSKNWMCFETFLTDIPKITGYNKIKFDLGELQLDKDFTQFMSTNKVYSLDTCILVARDINSRLQPTQQKEFIATSPDGKTYQDYNIAAFARTHNLDRRGISAVLNGRCKSHFNWTFKFMI